MATDKCIVRIEVADAMEKKCPSIESQATQDRYIFDHESRLRALEREHGR